MPPPTSPAILVARYLKTNGYGQTFAAFLEEAGLPPDAGSNNSKDDWTLEKLLEEKRLFDTSANFERFGVGDDQKDDCWNAVAPVTPTELPEVGQANVLSIASVPISAGEEPKFHILTTTSDRRLGFYSAAVAREGKLAFTREAAYSMYSDSPVLSSAPVYVWNGEDGTRTHFESGSAQYLLVSSMTGSIALLDLLSAQIIAKRTDHAKYCVKVVTSKDGNWMATAGWDGMILVYDAVFSNTGLKKPRAKIVLESNPENIMFVEHPETREVILLASRRDSTYLSYYRMPTVVIAEDDSDSDSDGFEKDKTPNLELIGRQNLSPHSNSWNTFTPSHFALSPVQPDIIAVATSTTPHMKVMIVRLLFPTTSVGPVSLLDNPNGARQVLAMQTKEDAAILIHANTLAPQTTYSTPMVVWRPDGSGLWVNGDDGVVRGIEAKTGKVVSTLKGGHDPGVKIRCLWAGVGADDREWLCSGGFDKRAVVWQVDTKAEA